MKILEFDYIKKGATEPAPYKLLVLNEDKESVKGISLDKLTEEEVVELKKIQEDYEAQLKAFMKNYRQFKKENIVEDEA